MILKKKKEPHDEAIEFLPDADEIERRPLPSEARITIHVLLAALVTFLAWACISETDLIVTARGSLITHLPNIVVQPLENAIIKTIEVRPGQSVKKGDVLATLDPTFTQADEVELRSRLHSLDNQVVRLNSELSGKPLAKSQGEDPDADTVLQNRLSDERRQNFIAQRKRFEESIARLRAELQTTRSDQISLTARVKVMKESESLQEQLVAQKYAIRARLLDAQDRSLEAERSLQLSRNRELEQQKALASLEAEKLTFETGWRQKEMEELLTVSRERDGVKEQLQKADKRNQLVTLLAPANGVVLDVAKLSAGSVIRGTETMFTVVPLDEELEAEVKVDAIDVGYVKVGDPVMVKIDAYPFQRHGALHGDLHILSRDAFKRDASTPTGMEAYYIGRVKLKSLRLTKMPADAYLLPGMTLSAEIVVGKRSVISYLIWPLIRAMDESIREP